MKQYHPDPEGDQPEHPHPHDHHTDQSPPYLTLAGLVILVLLGIILVIYTSCTSI
jgi:hypothetical protein